MSFHTVFAITLILARSILAGPSNNVYFSLIVSNGEFGYNSTGAIPAVDIALEYVKSNQILPDYNLMYERVGNSKVGS